MQVNKSVKSTNKSRAMSLLLNNMESVTKDIVGNLTDPEFFDVRIVGTDGEVPANKTILSIRSQYFRSMFGSNNNFVESQAGSAKLPYPKVVLDKMVLYLYSGQLGCDDLSLRALMDLLELFNMMNLPSEYGKVEEYTSDNIKKGKFSLSDGLKCLEDSSKLGLKAVGEALLSHLGGNFSQISQLDEIEVLSQPMMIRLLQEKIEERSQTILRFRTFEKWLFVNSIDDVVKSDVLEMFDFDDFTFKELNSAVRKSGLYDLDKIMERLQQLYDAKAIGCITTEDKKKYNTWFADLNHFGVLYEMDVRGFLMERFELSKSTMDKIWELSDQHMGGSLDRYEFSVACHLASRSHHGEEIPDQVGHLLLLSSLFNNT